MTESRVLQALPEEWTRALAVVAHPDDLEYGSASAIARWTAQGKQIAYLLVTRGEAGIDSMSPSEAGPLREEEERRSARAVGIDSVEFLDYPDGTIEYGLPLRRDIARAIRRHRPDALFSLNWQRTWGGNYLNMADHINVGQALMEAGKDAGNRWIFPELMAEGLDPWSGVHMICFNGSPQATHFVDVSGHIEEGIASLREHAVYIAGLGTDFDPDPFLRNSAAGIGKDVGCKYAVSFEAYFM
jgi:LmbE family N-acetylglucosaminyl deacetylase